MAELVSIIGRLRRLRGSGGTPEHPIELPGEPVDPDYGIDEGFQPEHPIVLPDPPPGIWPPPTVAHPIEPVPPPSPGAPGNLPSLPPGMIWPSPGKPEQLPSLPSAKFVVLAYIPGYGFKYVVVDPSLKPTPSK